MTTHTEIKSTTITITLSEHEQGLLLGALGELKSKSERGGFYHRASMYTTLSTRVKDALNEAHSK